MLSRVILWGFLVCNANTHECMAVGPYPDVATAVAVADSVSFPYYATLPGDWHSVHKQAPSIAEPDITIPKPTNPPLVTRVVPSE